MPELSLKEKVNALFDEDIRQKLYELVKNEDDVNNVIRYLTNDLKDWRQGMADEFYENSDEEDTDYYKG